MTAERITGRSRLHHVIEGSTSDRETTRRPLTPQDHAKILSFRGMAESLLRDINARRLPQDVRVLVRRNNQNKFPRFPAPLAQSVARDRLDNLGFSPYITLILDMDENLQSQSKEKLTSKQIAERRRVIGYQWHKFPRDARIKREAAVTLDTMITDATAAKQALVRTHEPLIEQIAYKYRNKGIDWKELISIGYMGLDTASVGFDWRRGDAFASYAAKTIRGTLLHAFRAEFGSSLPKPTSRVFDAYARVRLADIELTSRGEAATDASVASITGLPEDLVEETRRYIHMRATSLDQSTAWDGVTLVDTVADVEPGYTMVEESDAVRRLLAHLPQRERDLVVRRVFRGQTLRQIGKEVGYSGFHVSRLISAAMATLRTVVENNSRSTDHPHGKSK